MVSEFTCREKIMEKGWDWNMIPQVSEIKNTWRLPSRNQWIDDDIRDWNDQNCRNRAWLVSLEPRTKAVRTNQKTLTSWILVLSVMEKKPHFELLASNNAYWKKGHFLHSTPYCPTWHLCRITTWSVSSLSCISAEEFWKKSPLLNCCCGDFSALQFHRYGHICQKPQCCCI